MKPSEDDSIHGGCETKLQGNGHLDARRCEEKTCDRHLANPNPHSKNNEFNVTERDDDEDKLDTRCPRCLISYNDKPETDTEGAVDKYRNASGASKGSERNTNNKTCRGFSEDRKGENPRGKTKISERDRMDTRTAIFEMVLLRYEKHKHIKKKWDGEERLKECADYVRAAYRMVEASLKGSLEEMPKLRPGLTDYEIVELAGEDGLLLEITSELKIRLDGAEGLLVRSGMDEVKDHHGKFSIF